MISDEFTTILMGLSAGFSLLQGVAGFASGRQNAAYAEADAKQATINSQAEATRQRRIVASQQATLRAETGASGTEFIGSPMEVYIANAKQGEIEAQDKLYAGKLKARSLKAEADIYGRQGTMSLLGGFAGAAGTLGQGLLNNKTPKPAPKP